MEFEDQKNYVKIRLFSELIDGIRFTDNQRKLVNDLIFEMSELNSTLTSLTTGDYKIFLLPLLMIEGESSSLIEGTKTRIDDFAYDIVEMNNIPQWETRNLINLYHKYFNGDYYNKNFIFSADSIANIHLELYANDSNKKFKMTYDTSKEISRVKPGKIMKDDADPNFIAGTTADIRDASIIMVKPSRKREYLDDLMETIHDKYEKDSLLIEHIALMHPLFEAIHPFVDGNGRVGRLFLSLSLKFLYKQLNFPIYLSEFFNNNEKKYKQILRDVQLNDNYDSWNEWISFFIDSLITSKRKMSDRVKDIIKLWKQIEDSNSINTTIRKEIAKIFFKYYKIKKYFAMEKLKIDHKGVSIQTLYNDWNIVTKALNIKDNGDGYYVFSNLYKIIRQS
ncbi:Fic family protein [Candidatus Mycoplasma mahonii]|uniref:Fic family protein n=1 Tax=Candidatus Mycoplasma mahonii TaxID=3004105 RepID=UPI0026EBEF2E|nr:Fic family protein [Candidatus Mycoplasma mahonii]WKX02360.1 Fic family protein [Candidatus Mycoplasma mahonii]